MGISRIYRRSGRCLRRRHHRRSECIGWLSFPPFFVSLLCIVWGLWLGSIQVGGRERKSGDITFMSFSSRSYFFFVAVCFVSSIRDRDQVICVITEDMSAYIFESIVESKLDSVQYSQATPTVSSFTCLHLTSVSLSRFRLFIDHWTILPLKDNPVRRHDAIQRSLEQQ